MRVFLLTAILQVACCCINAQGVELELARLRTHLSLPATYAIRQIDDSQFPSSPDLKVFVATGLDNHIEKNLAVWFNDWNSSKGQKYGTVTLTPNTDQADVVLAQYELTDNIQNVTETSSRIVPGTAWDPSTNSTVTRPVAKTSSRTTALVPIFAYILVRQSDSLGIIRRYVVTASLAPTKRDGMAWRDDLFALIKERRRIK
jgi:hypothetical protein